MLGYIHLNTFLLFIYLSQVQGALPAPAHSPEAHTDLICHTSQASECYPAIFQPTEHFQPIHDDQSIPPGLHVRLNLATGLKEARLNVPEPEDAPKADVVLIDNPPSASIEEQAPLIPNVPAQEQASSLSDSDYDFSGPLPDAPSDEADQVEYYRQHAPQLFPFRGIDSQSDGALRAMTALTELAHSLEWGQEITSTPRLAQAFVHYIDPTSASPIELQSAAAQLLGTAIQNNPEALNGLLKHFPPVGHPQPRPMDAVYAALKHSIDKKPTAENTKLQKRLLFFLYQLSHDTEIYLSKLEIWAHTSDLPTLLAVLNTEPMSLDDGRDKVRAWVVDYLLDFILPELRKFGTNPFVGNTPSDGKVKDIGVQNPFKDMEVKSWRLVFQEIIKLYDSAAVEGLSDGSLEAYDRVKSVYHILGTFVEADSLYQVEL